MAQPSATVTSALPKVGICAITLKSGPSIHLYELDGGHLIAYDRNTWTRELIEDFARMRFGDYELVEPATGGA